MDTNLDDLRAYLKTALSNHTAVDLNPIIDDAFIRFQHRAEPAKTTTFAYKSGQVVAPGTVVPPNALVRNEETGDVVAPGQPVPTKGTFRSMGDRLPAVPPPTVTPTVPPVAPVPPKTK